MLLNAWILPKISSLPPPPNRVSLPDPFGRSPPPPNIWSLPLPDQMTSLPDPPKIVAFAVYGMSTVDGLLSLR